MSVKGFNFGGGVEKYDYDHLENKLEKTALAKEFVANKAYVTGDMITHDGKLYSRKTDGADTSWTADNWIETDIDARLDAVEESVSDLKEDLNTFIIASGRFQGNSDQYNYTMIRGSFKKDSVLYIQAITDAEINIVGRYPTTVLKNRIKSGIYSVTLANDFTEIGVYLLQDGFAELNILGSAFIEEIQKESNELHEVNLNVIERVHGKYIETKSRTTYYSGKLWKNDTQIVYNDGNSASAIVERVDKVRITGYGWDNTYGYYLYAFYDINGNVVNKVYDVDGSIAVTDLVVDVPDGSYEIRVNGNTNNHAEITMVYYSSDFDENMNEYRNKYPLVSGMRTFTSKDTIVTSSSLWRHDSFVSYDDTGSRAFAIVENADKVRISGYGWDKTYGYYLYAFYDSNGNAISKVYDVDGSRAVTDLVVDVPDGSHEIRVNGGATVNRPQAKIEINIYTEDFLEIYHRALEIDKEESYRIKIMTLGDSITALGTSERGWIRYLIERTGGILIANVAVISAVLADYNNTTYDGDPSMNYQPNNVIGNQIQKIINNNYDSPDIIIIAIGTNKGVHITNEDMNAAYYDSNNDLIPLESVDRTTDAGAFRYAIEKLHDLYPNAMIAWSTPIHACHKIRDPEDIVEYMKSFETATNFTGQFLIDTIHCGINGTKESEGVNGDYLADGLHPNVNGAKKIGYYIASKLIPFINGVFGVNTV